MSLNALFVATGNTFWLAKVLKWHQRYSDKITANELSTQTIVERWSTILELDSVRCQYRIKCMGISRYAHTFKTKVSKEISIRPHRRLQQPQGQGRRGLRRWLCDRTLR